MFSLPQRLKFLDPMVDKAWAAHCRRECITESTPASKKAWYRGELQKRFGVTTTARMGKGKEFDQAMALFEELADEGCYWQLKALNGDAKRARYALDQTVQTLRLTEEYVASIREQMGITAVVRSLSAEEAIRLRLALLYHVRRNIGARYQKKTKPEGTYAENDP